MPYGMPYNSDAATALAGMALGGGRPRRRARLQPMPSDLVGLPGTIDDPRLPIVSRRRAGSPGRRQQGLIPMVPPFTDPTAVGPLAPSPIGGRPRRRRFDQVPMGAVANPQLPTLAPTLPSAGPTPTLGGGFIPGLPNTGFLGFGG
jgi:hypothetical protein